ncbi:MAG TPA: tail fiber domain-containing protein, partial [Enhygromyxa sp.]|nr:tail fiber domain-containing protein [Enhygromyxa sp.]
DGDGDGDGDGDPGDGDGDTCVSQGGSCAGGELCCNGLECCEGVPVPPGQEFCSMQCPISDRNLKCGFESVDSQWVLDQVASLPLSTWTYKDGKDGYARHIGPMAQDFQAAFGVGASDRYIFQIDADGVSLAAIQALDAKLDELEAENQQLRTTVQALEARLAKLEQDR